MRTRTIPGILLILLILLVSEGGICNAAPSPNPPPELEMIRQAAAAYFPDQHQQYHISADALYALLHDGDDANDPLIISVQTREQFNRGHIPGAVNFPWDEIADIAHLTDRLPKEQLVVFYCNGCVYSAQMSAISNLLGYNTLDLAYGFESWTRDKTAIPDHFDPTCVCEHIMETQKQVALPTGSFPHLDVKGQTTEAIIIEAANAYLASERYTDPVVCPCDLEAKLEDDDPENDPFVLSLQWPGDYAKGHIPGAVNLPRWDLFQPEHLACLPVDQPIVTCCYLGFTSAQVVGILNIMGYDAQVSEHGMSAWTLDPQIARFNITDSRNWRNFPVERTITCVGLMTPCRQLPAALTAEPVTLVPGSMWPRQGIDSLQRDTGTRR